MSKDKKTIKLVSEDGDWKEFNIVYAPAPVLTDTDIQGIRMVIKGHYNECIHQNISCWGCELHIEIFRDMAEVQYVPVENES